MPRNRIIVLGAGPAGLWTALTLLERLPGIEVTLLEAEDVPGGLASSFSWHGLTFDYGSHRLHPSTGTGILDRIRGMLGDDLLTRPRNGRILLEGRFISFPLRPLEMVFRLPPSFSAGILRDGLLSPFRRNREAATFEEELLAGLGSTISRRFYFPYAEKLWGLPPGRLSTAHARRRISTGSIGGMAARAVGSLSLPWRRRERPFFYYPEGGFGQIAMETADRIRALGGRMMYSCRVVSVSPPAGDQPGSVSFQAPEGIDRRKADFVFSTIPVAELACMLTPRPPPEVREAAAGLASRSMVFCFLEAAGRQYTPFDAHYFPGGEVRFSRMSEPRNYSCTTSPTDRTGLCFEIPCGEGDRTWNLSDQGVRDLVLRDLASTGLPVPDLLDFTVRRRRCVYPVYDLGFETRFGAVDSYLDGIPGLVSLGRQGLFAHDNTHHTMAMGEAAGDCLGDGLSWDTDRWRGYRRSFREHVVSD